MSILKNTERIDLTIFGPVRDGDVEFNIYSTLLLGSAKDKNKVDPIRIRAYDSKKYNDISTCNNIQVRMSSYIVFSFKDYSNKENIYTEEVFFSYPKLDILNDFIENVADLVIGELSESVFTKKGKIHADYKDYMISTEEEKESNSKNNDRSNGDKCIWAFPNLLENEDGNITYKAVTICVNGEDNYITLGENAVLTLYNVFKDMSLQTLSIQTLNVGLLALLGEGTSSDEIGTGNSTRSPLSRRPARVPNARKSPGSRFKRRNDEDESEEETEVENEDDELDFKRPARRGRKPKEDDTSDLPDEDEDTEVDFDEEEEKPKKSTKKKTTKKKSSTSKRKKREEVDEDDDEEENTSYKELMKAAEEVEYEEDDDIDFDE